MTFMVTWCTLVGPGSFLDNVEASDVGLDKIFPSGRLQQKLTWVKEYISIRSGLRHNGSRMNLAGSSLSRTKQQEMTRIDLTPPFEKPAKLKLDPLWMVLLIMPIIALLRRMKNHRWKCGRHAELLSCNPQLDGRDALHWMNIPAWYTV